MRGLQRSRAHHPAIAGCVVFNYYPCALIDKDPGDRFVQVGGQVVDLLCRNFSDLH